MNVEETLLSLRLGADSRGQRERILRAARTARREHRFWRVGGLAAAATLAICFALNASLDVTLPPAPTSRLCDAVDEAAKSLDAENLRDRLRIALSPPRKLGPLEEMCP